MSIIGPSWRSYTRSAPVEPLWTSWGVHSVNDAARSIAVCGEQMVTGGWDRDKPVDAKPEPLIVWFNADGAFAGSRPDALAWTQTNGIACDREGRSSAAGCACQAMATRRFSQCPDRSDSAPGTRWGLPVLTLWVRSLVTRGASVREGAGGR
jgi:hypothetical protein